jgi:hypothetical protein
MAQLQFYSTASIDHLDTLPFDPRGIYSDPFPGPQYPVAMHGTAAAAAVVAR